MRKGEKERKEAKAATKLYSINALFKKNKTFMNIYIE